jgi:hypothetical protein
MAPKRRANIVRCEPDLPLSEFPAVRFNGWHWRKADVQKLRLDFARGSRLHCGMEIGAQQTELIQRLLLEAGRIMEDASPELALKLPGDPAEVRKRIDQLATNASALSALAAAAHALLEPLPDRG